MGIDRKRNLSAKIASFIACARRVNRTMMKVKPIVFLAFAAAIGAAVSIEEALPGAEIFHVCTEAKTAVSSIIKAGKDTEKCTAGPCNRTAAPMKLMDGDHKIYLAEKPVQPKKAPQRTRWFKHPTGTCTSHQNQLLEDSIAEVTGWFQKVHSSGKLNLSELEEYEENLSLLVNSEFHCVPDQDYCDTVEGGVVLSDSGPHQVSLCAQLFQRVGRSRRAMGLAVLHVMGARTQWAIQRRN